jgi:hypothetical protein
MIPIRTMAAAIALALASGPALAVSDDINKPLSSPDGTSACTDDPALVSDMKVYDPSCKEGGKSLRNLPERDKADVPPRKGSIESPPPPDTGEPLPAIAPGNEPETQP